MIKCELGRPIELAHDLRDELEASVDRWNHGIPVSSNMLVGLWCSLAANLKTRVWEHAEAQTWMDA